MHVIAVSVFGLCALLCRAAPADEASDVRAWLEAEFERSRAHITLGDVRLDFRRVWPPLLSDAELEAMERRVEGRPDHPDRRVLEEERRRRAGEAYEDFSVWYPSEGVFRINKTMPTRETLGYTDQASTPEGSSWSMTPAQLNVVTKGQAPPGYDYAGSESTVAHFVSMFRFGGVRKAPGVEIEIEDVQRSGGESYTAEVRFETEWGATRFRYDLRWDDGLARGFVTERILVGAESEDFADQIGSGARYRDWRMDPTLGEFLAGRIERLSAGGSLEEVLTLSGAEQEPPGFVERVTAVPDVRGDDPIRGGVTVTSVYDHRKGKERAYEMSPEREAFGEWSLSARAERGMRWAGWLTLVGLALALVGYRVWRSRGVGA
jgi:hypothetical protein